MRVFGSGSVLGSLVLAAAVAAGHVAGAEEKPGGIVSIGGAITEIIYALGAGDRLVARDTTSSFPAEARALPDIGYMRALSPESVLSVNPALIIAQDGAGPPQTIAVLEGANVPFISLPDQYSVSGIVDKIKAVGDLIDEPQKAHALAKSLSLKLAQVTSASEGRAAGHKKRVLFILSTQGGRIMASGKETAAAAVIEMAGGENAMTAFEGYKPLTDEAVIAAAPDAILMMEREGDHDSSVEELVAFPAIALTPAGKRGEVIRMDGLYLLGFGPRTADAVADLNADLYGG